jgi:hypothetical protein
MEGTYSSSLALYENAGVPRMMMMESFGYSILDLSNPANPTALQYDDMRWDPNDLVQSGDGQSAIQTFGVSPDGQRATISVNGPFEVWETLAGLQTNGYGFKVWGDFPPSRAWGTVVQHIDSRYIGYTLSTILVAADITTLPTALARNNQPYDTTAFPSAYSPPLLLVGNYLVYPSGTYPNPVITVIDASNPGPAGSIASAYKSVAIPSLASDPYSRPMASFAAALDPGDPTKLWILVELHPAAGETWPSYGLVSVTSSGGTLTATASPGLFPVATSGTWVNAGGASSLVASNGTLFAIMWAQRTSPSTQTGFYTSSSSVWPKTGSFQAVSGANLPATHASVLAGSGTSVYQYFPTGLSAYVIPLTCQP